MRINRNSGSIALVMITLLVSCIFTGCGEKEVEGVSGCVIGKDGSVEATIVRDFDQSLYDVGELKSMMDEEIRTYNFDHAGDRISAGDVECTDGVLTCVIDYASGDDYAEFNTRRFVIEEFEEAMASDLVRVSVKSVPDLEQTDLKTLEDTSHLYVLITDEPGYVTFPGKVRYFSDGVERITKKQIHVTDDMDGLAYIIYESK